MILCVKSYLPSCLKPLLNKFDMNECSELLSILYFGEILY